MKRLFTVLAMLLFVESVFAQIPQKMSFQAVIRNSNNVLVANKQIGMQISILQGSASGTPVYVETQTPTTNANGLVSIEIGGSLGFDTINWSINSYFINTKTDPNGGTNYTISGTSQLLSVPYALHAKTADKVTHPLGATQDISLKGTIIGDLQYWNGTAWILLHPGLAGQVLVINSSNIPVWQNVSASILLPPTATTLAATNIQLYSA